MKSAAPVQTIDSYIQGFPPDIRLLLNDMRNTIRKAAPLALETIKYGIPTYVFHGNLVHFAAFKNHIGFYPDPSGIEAFKNELADFKCSKGAIQFPHHNPLPLKLISRIVKFRVKENQFRNA